MSEKPTLTPIEDSDLRNQSENGGEISIPDFIRNFPIALHGARQIEVLDVPDAKFCLIHIEQEHLEDGENTKLTEKEICERRPSVVKVQTNIHTILTQLSAFPSVRDVYAEGIHHGNADEWTDYVQSAGMTRVQIRKMHERMQALKSEEQMLNLHAKQASELKDGDRVKTAKEQLSELQNAFREDEEKLSNLQQRLDRQVRFQDSGLLGMRELILHDKLKLHGAEYEIGETIPQELDFQQQQKFREDKVLEFVHRDSTRIAVVVFGGWHNFRDNVAEWNKKHPDERFSLVEISPTEYTDAYRVMVTPR